MGNFFLFAWLTAGVLLLGCYGAGVSAMDSSQTPGTGTKANSTLTGGGNYRVENNAWGKGSLTDWSQYIRVISNRGGILAAQWNWSWPNSGSNVKSYPEVIYGQKPGSQSSTASSLPEKINRINAATMSYDIASNHIGSGNTAFDIWLTDTKNPTTFGVPPITHEIMIWLESYGDMHPAGSLVEQTNIDGISYNIFVAEHFGPGWKYIAFQRVPSHLGAGSINLVQFLSYLRSKGLITGEEYLASIEFGNEVISGAGETRLNSYSVSVQ